METKKEEEEEKEDDKEEEEVNQKNISWKIKRTIPNQNKFMPKIEQNERRG